LEPTTMKAVKLISSVPCSSACCKCSHHSRAWLATSSVCLERSEVTAEE
jgi:hypothetical protein